MWELICHHTYKLPGIPVDLSDYDTHGLVEGLRDSDFFSDGVLPGSGGVRFPRPGSRIRIPPGKAWQPLVGIAVEVVARVHDSHFSGQTIIAGDGAFRLGTFRRPLSSPPPRGLELVANTFGDPNGFVSSHVHSVDGQPHFIPAHQWVKLRFVHDGLSTLKLFFDDQLVAQRTGLAAAVSSVGPLGVSIGAEPDVDQRFLKDGEIDEVKVWRLDPLKVGRQFLSRPLDEATANCWSKFIDRINATLAENPKCAELGPRLLAEVDRLRRAIAAQGPQALATYAAFCSEYAGLWKAGQLDSPEMEDLMARWCTWLQSMEIKPSPESGLSELIDSCLSNIVVESGLLDCDPQIAALVKLIRNTCA